LADELDQGIVRGELPPLIVILPFGDLIANENRFGDLSWSNIFLTDFMPLVESRFRIDMRKERRAIGGISRGGFWAYNIALRHPELFGAVGGHSAFFDRFHAPPEHNPLDLARNAEGIDSLRLWLDRGADDFARDGLDLMHDRLRQRDIPHDYLIFEEGQHNNAYWSAHLADYLRFYTADWLVEQGVGTDTQVVVSSPDQGVSNSESGWLLYLPAVSFPSVQTTISPDRLLRITLGEHDPNLVLDEDTFATLLEQGHVLHPDTRIVTADSLFNTLWRDRNTYTLLPFDQLTPRYRVLHIDEEHPLDTDLSLYPFAFKGETPNYDPAKLTRILLSGVTALTRLTREALDTNGLEWAGEAIRPYVARVDFFHTSNEVSFHPTCPETDGVRLAGVLSFCSRDYHFTLLVDLDVDIVELTGNHNNDYGFDAYRRTLDMYREARIPTIGGGETLADARRPLLLDHNGNRIAMIACNWIGPNYALVNEDLDRPGAAFCDWNWLNATLPQLAAENDVLIVTTQYLELEQYTPSNQQRFDFRGVADLGADVVVGTQAHKPQTFEFYDAGRDAEAFIHYGLGNLFFDQPFWGNRRFFMDQLFIYDGQLLTVDVFPGIIDDLARPRPMTADERDNFLYFMFVQQNGF
jgi:poly-gamma-glutamate synthesis protein (capsule biosynthesis protein)